MQAFPFLSGRFHCRFLGKDEQVARLEAYLKDLQPEAKAVEGKKSKSLKRVENHMSKPCNLRELVDRVKKSLCCTA